MGSSSIVRMVATTVKVFFSYSRAFVKSTLPLINTGASEKSTLVKLTSGQVWKSICSISERYLNRPEAMQNDAPACLNRFWPTIASKEVKSGSIKKIALRLKMDTKHFFVSKTSIGSGVFPRTTLSWSRVHLCRVLPSDVWVLPCTSLRVGLWRWPVVALVLWDTAYGPYLPGFLQMKMRRCTVRG